MAEENSGMIRALVSILPKEMRDFAGFFVMMFIAMAAVYGVAYLPKLLKNIVSPSEKCWELQDIRSKVYKVNKCTGEVFLFDQHDKKTVDVSKD